MRRLRKQLWTLALACLMVFAAAVPAYAAQGGGETAQPMLAEYAAVESSCYVSNSLSLTVKNEYVALDGVVNRVVVTTYVEKRSLLVLWDRVEIGQTNDEWVDYRYGSSGSASNSVQLPSTGTYRITATFKIYHGQTLLDTVERVNTVTC